MKNSKAALLLWGSQLFYAVFLPVWFIFFGLSVQMAEQGGFLGDIIVYAIGSYPFVLIAIIVISWSAYHKALWKKMILVNTIPVLWIAPILITFMIANLL